MYRLTMILLLGGLVTACGGLLKKDVRGFIEGTYVRAFSTEFAAGVDSVVITQQGEGHYLMVKYSRFSRLKNGEPLPGEQHEEKMAGVYDAAQQVIREEKKGKVISFDPEKRVMLIGASAYRKVK